MKHFFIFPLFIFFPGLVICQHLYTGKVIDKSSREKIPFASIGLIKEQTGINADENGNFEIPGIYSSDSLRISCVGYQTLVLPVSKLQGKIDAELQRAAVSLNEIIIGTGSKEMQQLNDFSNCGINYYVSNKHISQIAQHFRTTQPGAWLKQVNICKQGADCRFRLRIYGIDSITGRPSGDLTTAVIEVRSSRRHVHVNLEAYNIIIPGKDFFVAIEWIFIPSNAYTVKSKNNNGQKVTMIQYDPGIAIKDRSENELQEIVAVWMMDFAGRWMAGRFFNSKIRFLISPGIVY